MRVGLPWVVTMAVLVSCRGADAVGPTPAGVVSVEPRASSEVESSEPGVASESVSSKKAASDEPKATSEPTAAVAPPPPPQVVTAIQTPFPPEAIVVHPTVDDSPVVLFADEASAVRRRVGRALARNGLPIVPIAELERIETAAAAGRLVLEGDQTCRAPLTPAEVRARYFTGRRFATVAANCLDDCRVRVLVQDPAQPDLLDNYVSRTVSHPHDPRAWKAAAERLRPSETMGLIGLGLFGTSHAPPIRFNPPVGIGPWAEGQPDSLPFDSLEGTASSCAHPDPFAGFTFEVRTSVDRRGHVSRCSATSEHSLARPADGACLCRAIDAIALPTGAAGRRLRVQAVDDGGFGANGRFDVVQPGTEVWVMRLQESSALARCLASNPVPTLLAAQVTLSLAPDGAVDGVRIDGDITTVPVMSFASCMVGELRLVPLPCRPPGVDTLQVELVVNG